MVSSDFHFMMVEPADKGDGDKNVSGVDDNEKESFELEMAAVLRVGMLIASPEEYASA